MIYNNYKDYWNLFERTTEGKFICYEVYYNWFRHYKEAKEFSEWIAYLKNCDVKKFPITERYFKIPPHTVNWRETYKKMAQGIITVICDDCDNYIGFD